MRTWGSLQVTVYALSPSFPGTTLPSYSAQWVCVGCGLWVWRYLTERYLLTMYIGVLLRKLEAGLVGLSHVIVDEIHERDINVCYAALPLCYYV